MTVRSARMLAALAAGLVSVNCAGTPAAVTSQSAPPAAASPGQARPGLAPQPQASGAGASFEPTVGMAGKDVVWVPTSEQVIARMLDMAKLTPQDYVIDLGSGDGRNIIAAAKRGARGHGVEFNPDMVALSNRLAREAGVADRATFVQGDMYEADISKATVMALFLLPTNLEKLQDRILALPAGTRIVMNTFTIPGWEADESSTVGDGCTSWCNVILHIIPARVAGRWRIQGGGELTLTQTFQRVSGTFGANELASGRLLGANLSLESAGTTYTGRVDGDRISGTATSGGAGRPWAATRVAN